MVSNETAQARLTDGRGEPRAVGFTSRAAGRKPGDHESRGFRHPHTRAGPGRGAPLPGLAGQAAFWKIPQLTSPFPRSGGGRRPAQLSLPQGPVPPRPLRTQALMDACSHVSAHTRGAQTRAHIDAEAPPQPWCLLHSTACPRLRTLWTHCPLWDFRRGSVASAGPSCHEGGVLKNDFLRGTPAAGTGPQRAEAPAQ